MSAEHPVEDTVLDSTADTRAAELGLDPAGYTDPDTGVTTPWGAPASMIAGSEPDNSDGNGERYTVIDFLTDQAGAENIGLVEYLGYRGIGPDAEQDIDGDPYGDEDSY